MARSGSGKFSKQINVQIDNDLLDLLKIESVKTGAPMSWIIRQALLRYLQGQRS